MWRCFRNALFIVAACIYHPLICAAASTISSISPSSGFPGATVTITGEGFTSSNTIQFGQTAIPHVPVSQTNGTFQTLVFTVPEHALLGPYNVLVQNATGFSNPVGFRVVRFQALGFLPGGSLSQCHGLSSDGSVVVGEADTSSNLRQAFRWASGAMISVGDLPNGGGFSQAFGANADGSVVGWTENGDRYEAFRWTAATGMMGLGYFPGGIRSIATSTNADGSVIVGMATVGYSCCQAFRWSGGIMSGLGFLPGGTDSRAYAISADGLVIVGEGTDGQTHTQAFRWTASNGIVGLGFLTTAASESHAYAVNGNGSVVVGSSNGGAFRWTAITGMRSIQVLLTQASVDLTGWTLFSATGVSADGQIIAGTGTDPGGHTQAWIASLPLPPQMNKKH
jgi:probable HAF family extracellular repeat protein